MALSDNPRSKSLVYKVRKTTSGNARWSDKQKIEAIQTYLLVGNLNMTGRMLNIPEDTLRGWKQDVWWKNQLEEIKLQDKIVLSSKLKRISEAALSVVEDRLTNGDFVYDQKTGTMLRKQVSMKDAHKVSVDLLVRQDLMDKVETPLSSTETNNETLKKIAEQFAMFVTKKPSAPLVEVVDVDAKELV